MTNILILGANGQIARVAIDLFLKHTNARLTLYLRNARRLKLSGPDDHVRLVEGNVLDTKTLEAAMPARMLPTPTLPASWSSKPDAS